MWIRSSIGCWMNPNISDDLVRAGRSLLRKICRKDRFFAPDLSVPALDKKPVYLAKALADQARARNEEDLESVNQNHYIGKYGLKEALLVPLDSERTDLAFKEYNHLQVG